jgi:hypothetical protein
MECAQTEAEGFSYSGRTRIPVKAVGSKVLDLLRANDYKSKLGIQGLDLSKMRVLALFYEDLQSGQVEVAARSAANAMRKIGANPDASLAERIKSDPARFAIALLSSIAFSTKLILWKQSENGPLLTGLLCLKLKDALVVHLGFWIGEEARASRLAKCVVCGSLMARQRGRRRQSCSSKCRKQKSREARRAE